MKSVVGCLFFVGIFLIGFQSKAAPDKESPQVCQSGFNAFKTTIYPVLRQSCVACHGGAGPGPNHSVSDPLQSYKSISRYTDFNKIEKSLIYTKGGNEHCSSYGVNCGVNFQKIKSLVTQWWQAGEDKCAIENMSKKVSASKKLPMEQLKAAKGEYVPVRWSLAAFGVDFKDAYFEIEIQLYSEFEGNTYRLRKPRVGSLNTPLYIENLEFYLNGSLIDGANEFSTVRAQVPTVENMTETNFQTPVLSTEHVIILGEKAEGDSLAVGFGAVKVSSPQPCLALDSFKQNIIPYLNKRYCVSCHTQGQDAESLAAQRHWKMSMDDPEKLCAETKSRVNLDAPGTSAFIAYASRRFSGHPKADFSMEETYYFLKPWIDGENKK